MSNDNNAEFYSSAKSYARGFLVNKTWSGVEEATWRLWIGDYLKQFKGEPERTAYWLGEELKEETHKFGDTQIVNVMEYYDRIGGWSGCRQPTLEDEIANINQQFVDIDSGLAGTGTYTTDWEIWIPDVDGTKEHEAMGGEFPYLFMLNPTTRELHVLSINYSAPENYYPVLEVTL